MASFIKIHLQVTELWEKSYYFWIAPRTIQYKEFTNWDPEKSLLDLSKSISQAVLIAIL